METILKALEAHYHKCEADWNDSVERDAPAFEQDALYMRMAGAQEQLQVAREVADGLQTGD